MIEKQNKTLGASLLVAGTCIGAAALTLPLGLLNFGSLGVLLLLVLTAGVMWFSGMLVFEANSYFPEGTNLTMMTKILLGPKTAVIVVLLCLALLYSLLAAYMTGGGYLSHKMLSEFQLNVKWAYFDASCWAVMGLMLMLVRTSVLDYINRSFMALLILSYFSSVFKAVPYTHMKQIMAVPYHHGMVSLSLAMTAFGFQVVVPSLRKYLNGQPRAMMAAMAGGVLISLILYVIWCAIVYGVVPYSGPKGLSQLQQLPNASLRLTEFMSFYLHNTMLGHLVDMFLLAAIASSFFGIALSLKDFIQDIFAGHGLQMPSLGVALCVVLPPYLFAVLIPNGFEMSLRYAGLFVACINLLLPIALVYQVRKRTNSRTTQSVYRLPGGQLPFWIVGIYALAVIFENFL